MRTKFFTPAYLDNQVRLKTSLTPAAKWGPLVQGAVVLAAIAILFMAILHNGWFADLHRRLSELANRGGPLSDRSDDDPPGDDALADDAELDEDALHGPEKGDT